ncbi:MAG: hypothetical protein GKR98_15255 [Boseongicola sp.]|nr:MAG: hypothetical protein GKR98_15255 [Boseongicola sp.]
MADLAAGWEDGNSATLPPLHAIQPKGIPAFDPLPSGLSGHQVLSSRLLRRRSMLAKAEILANAGKRVSFFSFSLTPVRHHVSYSDKGVWVQTGGQFGRTTRSDSHFRWCRFARRLKDEIRRVALQRGIDET